MPEWEQNIWKGQELVDMKDIPDEKPRIELAALPPEIEAIAVSEKMQAATEQKTGGLVIEYLSRDKKSFQQKYSKLSGAELRRALTKLGYEGTEPLFKNFHHYVMTSFRAGFPRYIPDKKVR